MSSEISIGMVRIRVRLTEESKDRIWDRVALMTMSEHRFIFL